MPFDSLALYAPSAVAIGDFDGVHIGHKAVIKALCDISREKGLTPIALTFDVNTKNSRTLITPRRKEQLLLSCGAKQVITADYAAIKDVTAERFAEMLFESGVRYAVCGEGFRFGKNAAGDRDTLAAAGINVISLPHAVLHGESVSSTRIRAAAKSGDTAMLRELLGREPDII